MTVTQDMAIRGKARRDDDNAILLLSLLSLADVREADLWWRRQAPRAYRPMLSGAIDYNPEEMLWRGFTQEQVKAAVVSATNKAQKDINELTLLMIAGSMSLFDWQTNLAGIVKRQQIAVAGIARGGSNRMPFNELTRTAETVFDDAAGAKTTGDMVTYQLGRLERFARQIEEGHESLRTERQITERAELYARSSIPSYEQARGREALVVGFTEEFNELADSEHCFSPKDDPTPDCPSQTAAGWVRIGTLTPPGLRKCRMKCLCSVRYRRNVSVIRGAA